MSDDDAFRVVSWNVEHNGTGRDGSDERWHLAMDVLAALKPHVLLRQELTRADMYGRRAVWAEAARLGGHSAFLASATPESANATGVYTDPGLCEPTEFYEHATGMWHPICNPVVRLKGAQTNLSLASFHLCSFDPDRRVNEARRLTTLGKPGMAAIIGGDCNSYPHSEDEAAFLPDWDEVEDRSHFEHRTVDRDGQRVSDTRPDHILAGTHHGRPPVFVELGQYAATRLRQPGALSPTASLWRRDQGEMQRIDRIYATPQVTQALTSLEVIVNDEIREASDHCPVVATFSLSGVRRALAPSAATAA
ncbi:Exonuclease III [Streptomyces sp. 2112.2]|uniref:endonuclease/exonuclease/phosphatase family protein n=1 Tax=Streptomyces sp. 2112.2 TaxID=1881024 RepID=UPI000895A61F|nr:endonuclease/exonuclease/phosphatase family protein [Streptomyces sp. 2112.2]SED63225.1 Exonuclease III [Streptomyces sp. 2112.2]